MQVNDANTRLLQRLKERGGEDVHPAGQHDELGPLIQREHLLGQGRVVALTRVGDLLGVLFALGEEAATYEIEVLPGDAWQKG